MQIQLEKYVQGCIYFIYISVLIFIYSVVSYFSAYEAVIRALNKNQ